VIDTLSKEDALTAEALCDAEAQQAGAERAHGEALREVTEAESIFTTTESDTNWKRVARARDARDRAALSVATAQRRTKAARAAHRAAHEALVRAQLAALRARLTPATWLGRMAPGRTTASGSIPSRPSSLASR
jgi:hypothetical protein